MERTTGGADSMSGVQLGVWREDSEEDSGRRGQPQRWTLKRAVYTFKRAFVIKRVFFI